MSIQNGSMQRVQLPLSWEHQLPSPSLTVQGRRGLSQRQAGVRNVPLGNSRILGHGMGEEYEEIPRPNSSPG